MLNTLNNTLQLLTGMTQNQNSPAPAAQIPLPVASTTRPKNDLKPSPPPNFDGDRQKGRGFINTCQVYFRLRPDNFPDEQINLVGHDIHEPRPSPEMGKPNLSVGIDSC